MNMKVDINNIALALFVPCTSLVESWEPRDMDWARQREPRWPRVLCPGQRNQRGSQLRPGQLSCSPLEATLACPTWTPRVRWTRSVLFETTESEIVHKNIRINSELQWNGSNKMHRLVNKTNKILHFLTFVRST